MSNINNSIKTTLFLFVFLVFNNALFAQSEEGVPDMVDQEIFLEERGPVKPIIPKHLKNGKPRCWYTSEKLYGYVLNDSILIAPEYEQLDNVYSDFMIAKRQKSYGVINKKGEAVLPFDYLDLRASKKGTLIANKSLRYGLISPQNKILIPLEFRSVIPIDESGLIFSREHKQLVVHVMGADSIQVVSTFEYEAFELLEYKTKYTFSAKISGGKRGIIDLENRVLLPFEYDKISWSKGNFVCFANEKERYGLVNYQNQLRVPAQYKAFSSTAHANLFRVNNEQYKVGMIDSFGVLKIPMQYYECWVLDTSAYVKCKKAQQLYTLWDTTGKQYTEAMYEEIYWYKSAPKILLAQLPDKKWQVLDAQGKALNDRNLDDYYFYPSGFKGEIDGKAAIFNLSGKQVTDFRYTYTVLFNNVEEAERSARTARLPAGTLLVCMATNPEGKSVYIDHTGKEYLHSY